LLFYEETAISAVSFYLHLANTIKAQLLMFSIHTDLKTVKDMFKKLYIVLILGSALACKAAPPKAIKVPGSNDIQPDEQQVWFVKPLPG
jgi:hypothetical protein